MWPQPSDQKKRKPISLTSKAPPPHTLAASPGNLWHHRVLSLLLSLLFRMGEPASSINPSNKLHQNLVWNVAYLPLAFELCCFIKVASATMEPCIRWVTEACEKGRQHPGVKLGPEGTHTWEVTLCGNLMPWLWRPHLRQQSLRIAWWDWKL